MTLILQIYLFLSAFCLDLHVTSLLWFCLSLFCFLKIKKKFRCSILFFILLLPISIVEWNNNIESLYNKGQNKSLTVINKAGIHNLNFLMGTIGYISGFKEVGIETLYLAIPKEKNRSVVFNSNFAMESQKVRSFLKDHEKSGRKFSKYRLSWTRKEHLSDSMRVALTLNPSNLIVTTKNEKNGKTYYECKASIFVKYPDTSETKITLGGNKYIKVRIEEGIFAGLQKSGDMVPYEATWTWSVEKSKVENYSDFFWIDDFLEIILDLS